ncbi:helix-turn-helix transcriptional regulator [Psychrobacillus lasiicapitis]|uniref:WYL domain-containing protein n=1 Tax=Psychrobacillus lasiicapitis TaxID=1636719 RepID=A0A544SZT1_9BACI|nr:WYL domain-containing protein [Psychrobacillus lasiicapitis]TQR10718.1 WYL domain-containing protein [Psychrobacillus lasiicapitis]GGA43092.1 WYL domain-containing protein [Psychrobacillus lasiicapitis]
MRGDKEPQIHRILSMYERLTNGETLIKKEEATRFQISEKSIQRDIDSIRDFLELEKSNEYVYYDRWKKAYVFETKTPGWLRNEEIFAILKVLIESRAFPKKEMDSLIDKLTQLAKKGDQTVIQKMMANEKHLYVELFHKKELLDKLWQLSLAIQAKKAIVIHYKREFDEQASERKVKPVGIIFSEYYFYLIAYPVVKDFDYPTIYRVDRIERFEQTLIPFKVPYHERFQEGEFRKRVQFMYSGDLINFKFKFTGPSPQAVLDRLPTARVVEKLDDGLVFEAEVFGKGIKMWLLSQGEFVEVLGPESFRNELAIIHKKINQKYTK